MLHVVEDAAQKFGLAGFERINGVVELRRGDNVLPDHQQGPVGQVAEHLAVGEVAQRGRVDDDKFIAAPGQGDHLGQQRGGEQVDRVGIGPVAQQHVHAGCRVNGRGGQNLLRAVRGEKQVAEGGVFPQLHIQQPGLYRAAQVKVDKQHGAVAFGQGQGGVGRDGGFSFPLGHAGEEKDLFALALLVLQPGGDAVHGLGKGEADGGGGDLQISPLMPAEEGLAGALCRFMGDGADDPPVQPVFGGGHVVYGAAGEIQINNEAGHGGGQNQPRLLPQIPYIIYLVDGDGHVGGVQLVEHHRGGDIGRKVLVISHDGLHNQQRVTGRVGGDGQGNQVGVAQLGGAERAADAAAQILQNQIVHKTALKQLGIDVDHLGGGGAVAVIAAAGGDGEGGAAAVGPGDQIAQHQGDAHIADQKGQHQQPELAQQQPDDAQRLDLRPFEAYRVFVHDALLTAQQR